MATLLTINSSPDQTNAAYREVEWTATSTDVNIKAVRADVYIDGTYSSTIDGVQLLGTTDQFSFDVRKIMQADLVSELRTNITSLALTDAVTSAKTVNLRLFEVVLSGGVFTSTWAVNGLGTNYLTSSFINVANMATQHQETLTDWTVDSSSKKLLTMSLDNRRIPRGVPFQIGTIISSSSDTSVNVVALDANLNTISDTTSSTLSLPTSSKAIMEIPASIFSSDSVAFIDVKLLNVFSQDLSLTYRYKIEDYCELFPLFFQNHLGDFEHFNFGNKIVNKISTKNQRITKPLPSGFSSEDGGTSLLASSTTTKSTVTTAALSANELIFLEELIKNHTVVYKWYSAGVFLQYVVASHSTKVSDSEELINTISITLNPSNEHIVQNGD